MIPPLSPGGTALNSNIMLHQKRSVRTIFSVVCTFFPFIYLKKRKKKIIIPRPHSSSCHCMTCPEDIRCRIFLLPEIISLAHNVLFHGYLFSAPARQWGTRGDLKLRPAHLPEKRKKKHLTRRSQRRHHPREPRETTFFSC